MISDLIYNVPQKYKFVYDKKSVELPNCFKIAIQENWDELLNSGKNYTNGELYTVSSIEFDKDNCLNFNISKTDFAHYLYTVKQNFEGEHICRSIATSALFITSDNYYVLGKMSSSTSLADKIKFIGGAIDKDDFINNEFQPIECIKREVKEEIGLTLDDKSKVESINSSYFITRKNLSFINVCFRIKLNMSANKMVTLFNRHNESLHNQNLEQELDSIVLLKNEKNEINNFISNNKDKIIDYMEALFLVELGTNKARNFYDEINNQ